MKSLESITSRKTTTTQNSDIDGFEAAMLRAAERAHRRAAEHGLTIAIMKDGKIVHVKGEDLVSQLWSRPSDSSGEGSVKLAFLQLVGAFADFARTLFRKLVRLKCREKSDSRATQ